MLQLPVLRLQLSLSQAEAHWQCRGRLAVTHGHTVSLTIRTGCQSDLSHWQPAEPVPLPLAVAQWKALPVEGSTMYAYQCTAWQRHGDPVAVTDGETA